MPGGRPKKPFEETQRGKKALKKEENRKKKEEKMRKLDERRNLFNQGLCKAPDGKVVDFREVGYYGAEAGPRGAEAGARAWVNAGEGQQEARKEAGRSFFPNLREEEQEEIREIGRNAFANLGEDEQAMVIQEGRNAWDNLGPELQEAMRDKQDLGRQRGIATRVQRAFQKFNTPGIPMFQPNHDVWKCNGYVDDDDEYPCQFNCCKDVSMMSFVMISDFEVLRWLCHHRLMDIECNRPGCKQDCIPVSLGGSKVGLKCTVCGFLSKGGLRGFWRQGRLGITRMVAIVYSIVSGISLNFVKSVLDIKLNKNTWTKYVKDVGMVVAEALEKNRRDPANKYEFAQWDETAFGRRKYHRGARRRKVGVQWGLTCVSIDPDSKKTLAVDLQFLKFNKRDSNNITPLVVQRMLSGGTMFTDMWKAYPKAAEEAGVTHLTVNHNEGFKDHETGVHTNNVEGR